MRYDVPEKSQTAHAWLVTCSGCRCFNHFDHNPLLADAPGCPAPALHARLWIAVATLLLGGVFYTIGAVIYARKQPDPFPKVWGYHEVFHLFVILGSVAFVACVWIWALPFARM